MERKTFIEHPDGTKETVIEKSGFILRDAMFGIVGGVAGLAMGGLSVPIITEILPASIKASKATRYAAVGLSSFTVGEITEHSVKRALNDIADFSDGVHDEIVKRQFSSQQTQTEVVEETTTVKKQPSAKTVREARK